MSKGYKKMLEAVGKPQDKDDVSALLSMVSEYYPNFIFDGSSLGSEDLDKQSMAIFSYNPDTVIEDAPGASPATVMLTMVASALASFCSDMGMDAEHAAEKLYTVMKQTRDMRHDSNSIHRYKPKEDDGWRR